MEEGGEQRAHSGFSAIWGSNREDRDGTASETGGNSGERHVTTAWGITYFQREGRLQHHFCALFTRDA